MIRTTALGVASFLTLGAVAAAPLFEDEVRARAAYRAGLEALSEGDLDRADAHFASAEAFGAPPLPVAVRRTEASLRAGVAPGEGLRDAFAATLQHPASGRLLRRALRETRYARGETEAWARDLEHLAQAGGEFAADDLFEASRVRREDGETSAAAEDLRLLVAAYPRAARAYAAVLTLEALRDTVPSDPYEAHREAVICLAADDLLAARARLAPFAHRAIEPALRDDILLALGRLYLREDRLDEADRTFRRLWNDFPYGRAAAEARTWLLEIAIRRGDTGGIARLADAPATDDEAVRIARIARAVGRSRAALEILTRRFSNAPEVLFEAGLAALEVGDTRGARARLEAVADAGVATLAPKALLAARAHLVLAVIEEAEGNLHAARSHLAKARTSPDPYAALLAAHVLAARGLGQSLAPEPDTLPGEAPPAEATFLLDAGDTDLARAFLEAAAGAGDDGAAYARVLLALAEGDAATAFRWARRLAGRRGIPEIPAYLPEPLRTALFPRFGTASIDDAFLWAVARSRSGFDPHFIEGRRLGLFGLTPSDLPDTASVAELFDPTAASGHASRFAAARSAPFPQGRHDLVAAAYDAGTDAVVAWGLSSLPPVLAVHRIPTEEGRDFVREIVTALLALGAQGKYW